MLTLGVVTDEHFGAEATFGGKLRKLTAEAPALAQAFADRMREEVRPDFVVNLGDCVEDESHDLDLERYLRCLAILRSAGRPLVNVAGNHDRIHLRDDELRHAWGRTDDHALHRSFDAHGFHVVVLATAEEKDVAVTLDEAQLRWLEADLREHAHSPVVVLMHHSAADQDLRDNRWFSRAPHLCLVQQRRPLRALLEAHGDVRLVLNGHLHWNHLAVIGGIPYLTLQSLIENVDDDAPGRPAAAHAVVELDEHGTGIRIAGSHPMQLQFPRGSAGSV